MSKRVSKISVLQSELNATRAFLAVELSQIKSAIEQLENVVVALARTVKVEDELLVKELLDTISNTDYRLRVQALITKNQK